MSNGKAMVKRERKDAVAMLEQVRATIQKYHMYYSGDKVLVGVSGGPDSVALIHILHRLAGELGVELAVAHLNHGLRGKESEEDAEYVRRLAKGLGLAVVTESRDVAGYARQNRLSTQTAAREIRYRFFENAARQLQCNKLATGHNANDQAETVLFNFLRGAGPAGLGGIPPVRDKWVTRPLIEIHRAQIEVYCRENGLQPRIDKSNLKNVYTRNRLRLELIPYLEREFNPNLVDTMVRTGEIFRDEEECLEEIAEQYVSKIRLPGEANEVRFDLNQFLGLPRAIQRRIIRRAWLDLAGTANPLGFIHLADSLDIISCGQTGASLHLPSGITLNKLYGQFSLSRTAMGAETKSTDYEYKLTIPGETVIQELGYTILSKVLEGSQAHPEKPQPDEIVIDLDLVEQPLKVRSRKPGDRFRPSGLAGSKKLKDYFIDTKIPRTDRQRIPVLVTGDDEIIWVVGLRADRRWQATGRTKRALKLKLLRNIQKPN